MMLLTGEARDGSATVQMSVAEWARVRERLVLVRGALSLGPVIDAALAAAPGDRPVRIRLSREAIAMVREAGGWVAL